MSTEEKFRFDKSAKSLLLFSLVYLVASYFIVGFKTDQLVLIFLLIALFFISQQTRKILIVCFPYVIFWILFDYMKVFPNYNVKDVSIKELYETEKSIFGFLSDGKMVTPNEYFAVHNNKIFDILSGIFYLSWVTVPIFLTIYFLYTKQKEAIHLPFAFLLVNLIGFTVYYIYPAAPPWYVAQYGFEFIKHTQGNPAGLSRFDNALGINLFHSMYQKSSNVFAAMPSLHSAYPVVSLYFALKKKLVIISIIISFTAMGIWFFAVYSSHHYILDVIGGILCAVLGIIIYEILYSRQPHFRKIIDSFTKLRC